MCTSNDRKGFTLVELLFSVIVMSLVVTGILAIFVQTTEMSRRINYDYTATILAKSRLEWIKGYIKSHGFDSLTQANIGEDEARVDKNGVPEEGGLFARTTTVEASYAGDTTLTKVTVDVYYYYKGTQVASPITMQTVFVDIAE